MKKVLYIISMMLVLALSGCSNYALQEDLEALQKEVAELKALCEQLNSDVTALNAFMKAYENGKMVTHVVETSYGWTIYFTDDTYCDLRHGIGLEGEKGEKGDSPVVGIAKDTDGKYYWTLNGEFMLVNGSKVPTTGENGKNGENGEKILLAMARYLPEIQIDSP